MSIRHKTLSIIITLALVPTLTIGYIMDYYAQKTIIDSKQESLAVMAQMMDFHITRYYSTLLTDIKKKTELDFVKKLLVPEAAPNQLNHIAFQDDRMILLEDVSYPVVSGAIINRSGVVVLSSTPSEEGLMMDKTDFFRCIMNGGEAYLGMATIAHNSERFLVAVPIVDEEGNVLGVLKQILKLDPLKQYFDSINHEQNIYAFLLRRNGSIVFQYDQENKAMLYNDYQNTNSLDQLISNFKKNQLEKEDGTVEFDRNGAAYIGTYKKIGKINCIAIVSVNREKMLAELSQGRQILFIAMVFLIFIAVALGYYINELFMKSLRGISNSARKIADGDLTVRCKETNDEFMHLSSHINKMTDNLQKREKELRLSARIDNLTHLPNRYAIYEVLDTLLYKHPNQALLLMDLHRFEQINVNLGHDIGDRVLMEISDMLRNLPQNICYPARLSGDEFLIFITNWTAPKYPERVAAKIIKEIETFRFIDEIYVDISVNIGIEYTTAEKIDKKKLIKNSDFALQKAKDAGKNSYFIYYPNLQKEGL